MLQFLFFKYWMCVFFLPDVNALVSIFKLLNVQLVEMGAGRWAERKISNWKKRFLLALVWFLFLTRFFILYRMSMTMGSQVDFFLYQMSMPLPLFFNILWQMSMPMDANAPISFLYFFVATWWLSFLFSRCQCPFFVSDPGIFASLQQFFLQFFLYGLVVVVPYHQPKVF